MKAVVFHGIGDIRFDTVADPSIKDPGDAIVRLTSSAICGTDLHFVRGTMPGMKQGTILGHEGVGVVEEVGKGVRNLRRGDRVVIPSTIACGNCSYCRSGYTAQCDDANPNGPAAGTAFYGGPAPTGPFDGLQAEFARVPYAFHNLVRLPQDVTDDQAILLSDIYPTAWFGAECAEVGDGDVVVVWGCGPVGLFSVLSAFQKGAHRVIAVDGHEDRLERARLLGGRRVTGHWEKVRPGQTGRLIVEEARELRARAIVMPLPPRSAATSVFGKTVETVLSERPCRVIIQAEPSAGRAQPAARAAVARSA